MKTFTRSFLCIFFSVLVLTLVACGKEQVAPYVSPEGTSDVPEATDIEYTSPEYGEDMSPSVESLDSPSEADYQDSQQYGAMGQDAGGMDMESEEYKKTYGRSSQQLLPIYYDFDQATIRNDQFTRLDQNGDYLKNNLAAKVVIQGNCDERGTNEYNLALGDRRANSAKSYLAKSGVEASRMTTISYGEEQPLCGENTEYCWAKNRRGHFGIR